LEATTKTKEEEDNDDNLELARVEGKYKTAGTRKNRRPSRRKLNLGNKKMTKSIITFGEIFSNERIVDEIADVVETAGK
jgi:hypothetical protein